MVKHKTKNSFLVPHDTFDDPNFLKLPGSCHTLYIILCKIINRLDFENEKSETHWFYHSLKQLSQKTGLNMSTLVDAKQRLNAKHFIDIKKGYFVNGRHKSADYFRLNGFRMKNGEETKFENYQ